MWWCCREKSYKAKLTSLSYARDTVKSEREAEQKNGDLGREEEGEEGIKQR